MHCSTLGKTAVVVGRSHNVGLPIQTVLAADGAKGGCDLTTVLCHRHTPGHTLHAALATADLVVSAAGVPGLVTGSHLKPGAVVIDVGLSRVAGRLVGDADPSVREVRRGQPQSLLAIPSRPTGQVASVVTPVPGGVGPCTVACLMANTLLAARLQLGISCYLAHFDISI